MSSPVLSCGQPIQNGEYQQVLPSQESPTPSTTTTVNEVTERIFADPSISPSDGSCPILALTEGTNQPHLGRIMFYLPKWEQIRFPLLLNPVLEKKLKPLLSSFGVIYPYTEENEKQTLDRITTILNSLKWSEILTKDEKERFSSLSVEEIIQDPRELYLLLKRADRYNLVTMISKNVLSLDLTGKPFCQKVTAVLDYLEKKGEVITKLICSYQSLTNIPEEIFSLGSLQELNLSHNQLPTTLPEGIGSLVQLQELDLRNNKLTTLPEWIGGLVQLRWLFLRGNNLTALPEWLRQLSRLAKIDLFSEVYCANPRIAYGLVTDNF